MSRTPNMNRRMFHKKIEFVSPLDNKLKGNSVKTLVKIFLQEIPTTAVIYNELNKPVSPWVNPSSDRSFV